MDERPPETLASRTDAGGIRRVVSPLLSAALLAANIVLLTFLPAEARGGTEANFPALLAGIVASAVVERWRFGREGGWRARLDPLVMLAFLVAFDVVYVGASLIRDG